jgi:hypothetical protein
MRLRHYAWITALSILSLTAETNAQDLQLPPQSVPMNVQDAFNEMGYDVHSSTSTIAEADVIVLGDIHDQRDAVLGRLLRTFTTEKTDVLVEQPRGGYIDSTDLSTVTGHKRRLLHQDDQYRPLVDEGENTLYGIDVTDRATLDDRVAEHAIVMTAAAHVNGGNSLHPVEREVIDEAYGFKPDTTSYVKTLADSLEAVAARRDSARQDTIEANVLRHVHNANHTVVVTGVNHVNDMYGEGIAARLEDEDIDYVAFTERATKDGTDSIDYVYDIFIKPYLDRHGIDHDYAARVHALEDEDS